MTPRRIDSVPVLVRPPYDPWRMFEEVPSRALFPRAGIAGPTRRGPHAGSRRPLFSEQPRGISPFTVDFLSSTESFLTCGGLS
jgi:hypothetical protein